MPIVKTGYEAAKAVADKIREDKLMEDEKEKTQIAKEAEEIFGDEKAVVAVESSKSLAPVKTNIGVIGLEDIPASLIPIPFYRLVQPGSTGITMADGTDAENGTFFMSDSGIAVASVKFALLRAKRSHQKFIDRSTGVEKTVTKMGVLGVNLEGFTPFMLSMSITNFSTFGRLLGQYKARKVTKAWEYPVLMTTEKREETKVINGQPQKVKYWVINFQLTDEPVDKTGMEILDNAYSEYAGSLDREGGDISDDIPVPTDADR